MEALNSAVAPPSSDPSSDPSSNSSTTRGDATFRAEVADLRGEILNGVIVFLMLFGWASVFVTIVTPTAHTPRQATLLHGMALVLGAICAWLSWSRRWERVSRWLCALGVFGLAVLHLVAFPSATALMWVAIACLVLTVLLGPAAGWLSVAMTTVSVIPVVITQSDDVPAVVRALTLIAPVATVVYFTHLVSRTLFRALNWMIESYSLARQKEMELRDQSAQLAGALKSLSQTSAALARANGQLEGLVKYAEDARRSKQEFAAMISHELRAPLNLIIGFSDVILNASPTYNLSQLPAGLRSDIHVIHRNAQHLLKLVDDILDLSQLDMNHMTLVQDRLRVSEVIESALNDFSQLAESRGLWLKVEVEPGLPEIFGDRTRLKQVLLNLLGNAVRFTDHGGITIRACLDNRQETTAALSSVVHRPASVVISVSDTGVGISEADLQRVFEPFVQIEGSLRRKRSGSGLGLTISKQFVELHGGRMWVESELSVGSTFYFALPIAPASPYLALEDVPPTGRRSEVGALVVVEDKPVLFNLLKRHVQGVAVTHVHDIQELYTAEDCPEAIVINTPPQPNLNAESTRSMPDNLRHVPVLRCHTEGAFNMTGISQGVHTTNLPANVCRYLAKPFAREQLYEVLNYMLTQGQRAAVSANHDPKADGGTPESHILVVEDEEDTLRLLLRLLRAAPLTLRPERRVIPIAARSVEQALDYLLSLDSTSIDGIFLDLRLGTASGFDLLREMTRHPHLQRMPVCIVSGQEVRSQSLVTPYLLLERPGGLAGRETVEAIAALLRVILPGVQATAR